jgi:hypothetical protein
MIRLRCKFALLCILGSAAGCEPPCPPIPVDTRGVQPAATYDDLAVVLDAVVEKDGLVNPDVLEGAEVALDAQLQRLAVTGPTATPELFPDEEHALAYWYNARAAWSMKLLLVEHCPRQVRRERFLGTTFPLDGREMSLARIDEVLAGDRDFRTAAAAPGATRQYARLPTKPFEADGIRRRIADRFIEFVDDELRFVIDIRKKRILVPTALWQFRDRLIRHHHETYGVEAATLATALLPYVTGSAHRRLQDAVGYRIVEGRSRELATSAEDD